MTLFETLVNCETGEVTQKNLSSQEITDREAEAEIRKAESLSRETTRTALLTRLGLTADEAALLLA